MSGAAAGLGWIPEGWEQSVVGAPTFVFALKGTVVLSRNSYFINTVISLNLRCTRTLQMLLKGVLCVQV